MTRSLLSKIPGDQLGFSPAAGLHTVAWNAAHLVDIAGWTPGILKEDGMDLAEFEGAPDEDVAGVPQLLERFDANIEQSVAALDGVGDEKFDEPWTMKMNGQELFTMKKGDCLRKWVFSHTAHHRGILSTYVKLAGVEIGSIYGE